MKSTYSHFKTAGSVLFMAFLSACSVPKPGADLSGADTALTVTVAHATTTADHQVDVTGQIASAQTANISTRVMGYIKTIHVQVDDKVKRGQLLVSISNQDISAKKGQANAMIAAAKASAISAKKDMDRFAILFKQQSASQKELDNITLQYKAAQAQLQAAKEMSNEAGASLTYTNITAPFAGVITQKLADAGSLANPGMPLLTLEKGGSYQATAYLNEDQVSAVKQGMPLMISIASASKAIQANLTQVSVSGEGSGGQYLIKANIPDREAAGLYAGMSARITISIPQTQHGLKDDQILVPATAIVHQDELSGLYVVSPMGTAQLRWVRLGKITAGQAEVLTGLNRDESFITHADGRLFNGVPVKIK